MEQLYNWTPSISEIEPGLFIGDKGSSCHVPKLAENNITAMVSLARTQLARWDAEPNRAQVPQDRHIVISAVDNYTQDLLAKMAEACDFIEENRRDGNVLVHCSAGISRSATIVVAYLMRKNHQSLDSTLAFVRSNRKVRPNPNFMEQLRVWDETGYQLWTDGTKATPKPPYAAYLGRRASKLKEKELTGNEPAETVPGPPTAFSPATDLTSA